MKFKTALITGGTSGIGWALSQRLLDQGTKVYSVSRRIDKVPSYENFHSLKFDLFQVDDLKGFCQNFIEEYELPDLLVNNAGYGAFFEWNDFPEKEIHRQNKILFLAPILLTRFFAPLMAEAGNGAIMNLSSLAVTYPLPHMPMYNAGKSALSTFTRSMMLEYDEFPKFIDFRMGDVKTNFNESCSRQLNEAWSKKMKSAWKQIEKQLIDSPEPEFASVQIMKVLKKDKSGVFYGGGFFQSAIASWVHRFLSEDVIRKLLLNRYYDEV